MFVIGGNGARAEFTDKAMQELCDGRRLATKSRLNGFWPAKVARVIVQAPQEKRSRWSVTARVNRIGSPFGRWQTSLVQIDF
jgi:hypothetical protein